MKLKAGDTLGHYRIEEEVGHGGMATVYRAYHAPLERNVAIKVLPEFFAEDRAFRERFAREAATVAQLRHPNIVTVYDYGEEDGTPYIVTEFLPGDTLAARLGRPISVEESVAVLRPLASALDYAHDRGVVHRDVKPSNVMMSETGAPILTDFGLARIVGSMPRLTRTGTPVGTPEYMAPELAAGDVATPAVDRYSLAVVAYEMLTGTVPFTADTPLAVLLAHLHRPVPPASRINPDIAPDVDDVLRKGLEKEAEERFSTATAFVEALSAAAVKAPARANSPHRPVGAAAPEAPAATAVTPRDSGVAAGRPADFTAAAAYRSLRESPEEVAETAGTGLAGDLRTRAVIETLQHPTTLLPLATAAISATYLALLSPILGQGIVAAALMLGAAATGIAALVRGYPSEYANAAEELERQHKRAQRERESEELRRLRDTLQQGFSTVDSSEGLKALSQLANEFEQLQPALTRRSETDPLSMALVPALSLETYRRGLSVLIDALDLENATHTSGADRLRQEVAALEAEIRTLESDPAQAERMRLRAEILQSHQERLHMLDELQLRKDQLLYQAQRCEASLHRTRIDLTAFRTGGSESSVDAVIQALQKTIDQAKAVQAEIRRLGY